LAVKEEQGRKGEPTSGMEEEEEQGSLVVG